MITLAEATSEHKSRRFRPAGLCDICASAISLESEKGVYPGRAGIDRVVSSCRGGENYFWVVGPCSLLIERSTDDQGNRIEESTSVSGLLSSVYFLIDGNNPTGYAQIIEQSQTPGTPTITYIWGETLIQQDNAAGTPNAGTYYLIADAHGSTQLLVNATGGVVQTYNYDSSGNALGFTISSAITDYLFNQQYYDVISRQYYIRARNYDPATGTFTQQDSYTINPGDTANANLFLYAGADSINMFDPSGMISLTLGTAVHQYLSRTEFEINGAGGGERSV